LIKDCTETFQEEFLENLAFGKFLIHEKTKKLNCGPEITQNCEDSGLARADALAQPALLP